MRIVHYIPTLSPQDGGTATYMQQLADTLGTLVELHIVTHRTAEELAVRHACIHRLPARGWREIGRQYCRLLDEIKPDVVHVNCCWKPVFAYAAIWARKAGYKVVLSPHGMLEPWIVGRHYWTRKVPSLLLWQRKALGCSSVVHATAETEASNLRNIGSYCSLIRRWKPEVRVIANGLDVEQIVVRDDWKRSRTLLYLSRLHPKKGIDLLLSAFARQSAPGSPLEGYTLQIAGEGDASYTAYLKGLAESLGLADRVAWLGSVFYERKWSLLRKADLVVLPTRSENFGLVIAEALASGTPVLTTTGTPWRKDFDAYRCGWCVEVDEQAIGVALSEFASTADETLQEMGQRGRCLIEQKYDARIVCSQFVEMYKGLC